MPVNTEFTTFDWRWVERRVCSDTRQFVAGSACSVLDRRCARFGLLCLIHRVETLEVLGRSTVGRNRLVIPAEVRQHSAAVGLDFCDEEGVLVLFCGLEGLLEMRGGAGEIVLGPGRGGQDADSVRTPERIGHGLEATDRALGERGSESGVAPVDAKHGAFCLCHGHDIWTAMIGRELYGPLEVMIGIAPEAEIAVADSEVVVGLREPADRPEPLICDERALVGEKGFVTAPADIREHPEIVCGARGEIVVLPCSSALEQFAEPLLGRGDVAGLEMGHSGDVDDVQLKMSVTGLPNGRFDPADHLECGQRFTEPPKSIGEVEIDLRLIGTHASSSLLAHALREPLPVTLSGKRTDLVQRDL